MRLLARYGSADELALDVKDQLPRGGMVVRTPVPSGLQLFSSVEVAVECGGNAIVVAGQVLQIFPGIGVAVGLDRPARDRIEVLAGSERRASNEQTVPAAYAAAGGEPEEVGGDAEGVVAAGDPAEIDVELSARLARGTAKPMEDAPPMPVPDEPPAPRRVLAAGSSPSIDAIQLALRGDRDQRFAILRGRNRSAHVYVLRNPGVTLDEVVVIARMASVSPAVLVEIAGRREWGTRPEVAMALARNPATPVPVAIKAVEFVSITDLRLLVKDTGTREPVQRAARKKLLS